MFCRVSPGPPFLLFYTKPSRLKRGEGEGEKKGEEYFARRCIVSSPLLLERGKGRGGRGKERALAVLVLLPIRSVTLVRVLEKREKGEGNEELREHEPLLLGCEKLLGSAPDPKEKGKGGGSAWPR